MLKDCNGNELVKDKLYRYQPTGIEYEFGYRGGTCCAICYVPGKRNMQDSVAIKDSTQLEPLGVRKTVEQPNQPDSSLGGAVTPKFHGIAVKLQDAAEKALEPIEQRAIYLAKRLHTLRCIFYAKLKGKEYDPKRERGRYYYDLEGIDEKGVTIKESWVLMDEDVEFITIPAEELWMDERKWEELMVDRITQEYEKKQREQHKKDLAEAKEKLVDAQSRMDRLTKR